MMCVLSLALFGKTAAYAAGPAPKAATPAAIENVTSKDQLDSLFHSNADMLLVIAIAPDCANCKQLPALLAQQARKHPGVKIVTADARTFGLPADKLPIAAMFEPNTRFLLDFTSAKAPAYLDANVNLTPANIGRWMNEREHNARVELWDEHRYHRLFAAALSMQHTVLELFQLGDSYPMRIKRARLDQRLANCFGEMAALQARFYHNRALDQKWKPKTENN
jgi:hypothetical protein